MFLMITTFVKSWTTSAQDAVSVTNDEATGPCWRSSPVSSSVSRAVNRRLAKANKCVNFALALQAHRHCCYISDGDLLRDDRAPYARATYEFDVRFGQWTGHRRQTTTNKYGALSRQIFTHPSAYIRYVPSLACSIKPMPRLSHIWFNLIPYNCPLNSFRSCF